MFFVWASGKFSRGCCVLAVVTGKHNKGSIMGIFVAMFDAMGTVALGMLAMRTLANKGMEEIRIDMVMVAMGTQNRNEIPKKNVVCTSKPAITCMHYN